MKTRRDVSRTGLARRNGATSPDPRLGGATTRRCPPVHVEFVEAPDLDLRLRQLARVLLVREQPIEDDRGQA